jgi:putative transport protein
MGVASDQIARLNLPEDQTKTFLNQIPIGYAVTYIFGTIGSAIILAQLGPKLIGVDLVQACKDYEKQLGGGQTSAEPGVFSAYRKFELRAYQIPPGSDMIGKPVGLLPGLRVYVERIRRGEKVIDADARTMLQAGDVVAMSGRHEFLVGDVGSLLQEVQDHELLDLQAEVVDVLVTNKSISGKTLQELSEMPFARGVYLGKITRSMVELPILPGTEVQRGDILTIGGSKRHVEAAIKELGACPLCVGRRRRGADWVRLEARGRRERPQAAASPAFCGIGVAADRLHPWASFSRLWAVQTIAHSQRTFSMPRSRNWRKPRACLICPNTGSTTCLRSR